MRPKIKRNLISISQFYKNNNISIEFFPDSFLVKDLSMGAHLVQGLNRGNTNEWTLAPQITQPTIHSSVAAPVDMWHRHLGHPSSLIQHKLLSSFSLSISKSHSSMMHCDACRSNKSHR